MSSHQPNLAKVLAQLENLSLDQKQGVVTHLQSFITLERAAKFNRVIGQRTRRITVVLEDIYQAHNASAVLRSCDCFGVQDVHIIENRNSFSPNSGVSIGAHQWLNIYRARENEAASKLDRFGPAIYTQPALKKLKDKGYKIIATSPHQASITLDDINLNHPVALLFGSEQDGLSAEALQMADEKMIVPMYGFSESFNISVTVALCLHTLAQKLRKLENGWQLSPMEQMDTLLQWLVRTVSGSDYIVSKYLEK